jgi:hypothetical protein
MIRTPRAQVFVRFDGMEKIDIANLSLFDRHGAPTHLTHHFTDRLLVIFLRHLA